MGTGVKITATNSRCKRKKKYRESFQNGKGVAGKWQKEGLWVEAFNPEQERGIVCSPRAKGVRLCCTRALARFKAGKGRHEDFGPEALSSQQCGNWPGRGQGEQRGSNPGITRESVSVPGAGRAAREKPGGRVDKAMASGCGHEGNPERSPGFQCGEQGMRQG